MKTLYVIKHEGPQYWYERAKDMYLQGAYKIYPVWEIGLDEAHKFETEVEALSAYKAIREVTHIMPDDTGVGKGILIKTDDENETWEELYTIEDL